MQANLLTVGASEILGLAYDSPGRPKVGVRAFFHCGADGGLLLDWDALTAYSDAPWPEIKTNRSAVPVLVRAVAKSSSCQNHEFGDSLRYLAIKLHSPDGMNYFNAYVPRETVLALAMANHVGVVMPQKLKPNTPNSFLRPPGSRVLVTLRIAYGPKSDSADNVLITQFVADRWLVLPVEDWEEMDSFALVDRRGRVRDFHPASPSPCAPAS